MNRLVKETKLLNYYSVFKTFVHDDAKISTNTKGPLHGIRICDMTRILAGPYCTMVLGDMGAEVIKIEREEVGDETRTWGPPFVKGESYYNLSINRNKKSICVDIQKQSGKEIIYDLVKKSDIFIENFIYGKLDSLGLGFEKLSVINPCLIYCSLNGYGSRGIDKNKPGYDLVANAVAGLLHVTGPMGGPPCRPGVALTDILTGIYAHSAIISALYERSFTNKGKKIDVSLLQSQVSMLSYHACSYLNKGIEATRFGSAHSSVVPCKAFKTSDGELVITATSDEIFKNLCKAIGYHDLCFDDRFKTNSDRVENRDALELIIGNCVNNKSSEYWLSLLREAGVPCGPVNNLSEAFRSPQVSALNIVHEILHPLIGAIKLTGPGVVLDGKSFTSPPLHPPLLGEHTEEILNTNDKINI